MFREHGFEAGLEPARGLGLIVGGVPCGVVVSTAFTLTVAVVMSHGTVTSADAQTGGVREVSATERGVIPILENDGYSVIA